MIILIINGPNLNKLGQRDKSIYGDMTLVKINDVIKKEAAKLEVEIVSFQSNSEGTLIDFIQEYSAKAKGIIINPGALSHYCFALRDALSDSGLPIIEVHLSNIYAREEWRSKSITASVAKGFIMGMGWRGYIAALYALVWELKGRIWD